MQYDQEYFGSEEFRELLDSYETAVADGNYPFIDADDLVDIADYYNMSGDYDRAMAVVDYALQLYPNATLPNVFMARDALQNGDYATAQQYAEAIEQKDDPDAQYLQAEIMIAKGDIDAADQYLREKAQSVPDDEYEDYVRDCANLYIDYNISDKAYQWMMRSKGDNSIDFKELMGRTLLGLGKLKDAQRLFNELLDADPYNTQYWNSLASAQLLNGEYSEAITSSEYALAINPNDTDALAVKASGLVQLGNTEEAIKYCRRYVEIIPDDYPFMAACCFELGFADEFLYFLQLACKEDPEGTKEALGALFPEDMDVKEYTKYMKQKLKR